jgi:UDP-N-acetylmuramyl pentapeptide phosphotransferase/UDP-N-acetylglucosamine-1-phosphate transferase
LASVGVLSAAIITPVAIGLGVLVTVCGVVSIIVKVVHKKNTIKLKRHYAIHSHTGGR